MTFNLLPAAMAATNILGCNKSFKFYKFKGSTLDELGRDIPEYFDPASYTGSIQAVPNRIYEQLGLELDKNYKTIFCPELMRSLAESTQSDIIEYDGKKYQIIENKNYYETNGWTKALVAELKNERSDINP